MAISGSPICSALQQCKEHCEKIDKELECVHNGQMEHLKDGGAIADVEHSLSPRRDERYSRNEGLRSGHSSPSPEFPSLLPLSEGICLQFRVRWRLTGRDNKTVIWMRREKKRPAGQIGCYAEDNKSLNDGIIRSKEADRALRLRNRLLCRSNMRLHPGTAI